MPVVTHKKISLKRKRSRKSPQANESTRSHPRRDLASLVRGMYGRVARELGVDPSYVSRVARGERQSELVDAALRRALSKIVLYAGRQRVADRTTTHRKLPKQ